MWKNTQNRKEKQSYFGQSFAEEKKKKGSSTAFEHSEPSLTNSVRNNTSAYKNYLEILLLCPIVWS